MLDLRTPHNEGINNLLTWRNRYSSLEYPEKIVLNMFYRKYTMDFLWPEIAYINSNKTWSDFGSGVKEIEEMFSACAINKTRNNLEHLLKNDGARIVGNCSYDSFKQRISRAKSGNKKELEELEYAFLYYLLTDKCVLYFAVLIGLGIKKMDAISQLSGYILEEVQINDYETISAILGQVCAAQYLNQFYSPLP